MGWPLEFTSHLALSATFRWGLTGYATSEETGPLEKSAALYQKAPGATSEDCHSISRRPVLIRLPGYVVTAPYRRSRSSPSGRSRACILLLSVPQPRWTNHTDIPKPLAGSLLRKPKRLSEPIFTPTYLQSEHLFCSAECLYDFMSYHKAQLSQIAASGGAQSISSANGCAAGRQGDLLSCRPVAHYRQTDIT